jgi:hypothetical protein
MISDKRVADNNREFGMQGYPDIRTVEEWDDDKTQLFPQSRTSVNHNKAVSLSVRLYTRLTGRTGLKDDWNYT